MTRTLQGLTNRIPTSPPLDSPVEQSNTRPLQRSLDQLRAASARIDRILSEERSRNLNRLLAMDADPSSSPAFSSPTPQTTTSNLDEVAATARSSNETIRMLRETTSALLTELSNTATATTSTSNPTPPSNYYNLRQIASNSAVDFRPNPPSNFHILDLTNRRRAVYQIVVDRNGNRMLPQGGSLLDLFTAPSSSPLPSMTVPTSDVTTNGNEEQEKEFMRGYAKLDRNGDEVKSDGSSGGESGEDKVERIERVGR